MHGKLGRILTTVSLVSKNVMKDHIFKECNDDHKFSEDKDSFRQCLIAAYVIHGLVDSLGGWQ